MLRGIGAIKGKYWTEIFSKKRVVLTYDIVTG